jgi:hypothetical protein
MPKLSPILKDALQRLDFDISGKAKSHLLFTSDLKRRTTFSSKELFTLEIAKEHMADAVYFRRFEDGRTPMPQIFIYDFSQRLKKDIVAIHRDLWSSCVVPIFLVIDKTQIQIYDCRKPIEVDTNGKISNRIFDTLKLANEAVEMFNRYSAKGFDKGTFWEQENIRDNFKSDTTAYNKLIEGLKNIRNSFIRESSLSPALVDKLLVRCILIKYLEERGNGDNKRFAESFFKKFGAKDFSALLEKGKILEVFDALAKHFNGHVFAWDGDNAIEERKIIQNTNLAGLASYLDGKNITGNLQFWSQFSFQYLPVEVISSIYETFLKDEDDSGLVYTPDHLVNLLVDECMDPDDFEDKADFKVIDGSCGSGIFLVKAFKRMIQWWRYREYHLTGIARRPDIDDLNGILTKNIYGVELKENAAQLTIFSLAIALCDELSPKEIWNKLKFKDLSQKNIVHKDFFKFLQIVDKNSFDLVIGNPPFDELNQVDFDQIIRENNLTIRKKIPQNQLALLFLDQAMCLLKPDARLCLILPSGPIIYNDTLDFRNYFFSHYNVDEVIDFSNLNAILFEGQANVPVVGFYVQNRKPTKDNIAHVIVNRTKVSKDKIYFEIDHYDIFWIEKNDALTSKTIWKANLLGGGRLIDIVARFSNIQTINDYLDYKKKDGWNHGEGYIVGHDNSKSETQLIALKFHEGLHLREQKTLKTNALTECGLENDAFEIEQNRYYRRERNPKLFNPPFVLIKELFGEERIPTYFSDEHFIYKHQIMGISAPLDERQILKDFYDGFNKNNDIYRLLISLTSNHFLISWSSAISKSSILNLPSPLNDVSFKLSYSEETIKNDVLIYIIENIRKGENSMISKQASLEQLKLFSIDYCKTLNSIYQSDKKKFRLHHVFEASTYYACEYHLSKKAFDETLIKLETSSKAINNLDSLLIKEYGLSAHITRVLKVFQNNKIYLIKPKPLRYWLKSIALRDADETLTEIIEA